MPSAGGSQVAASEQRVVWCPSNPAQVRRKLAALGCRLRRRSGPGRERDASKPPGSPNLDE